MTRPPNGWLGLLDLDAPVERYLPDDFAAGSPQGAITMRQAMSHTSGLPFASAVELAHPGGLDSHGRCCHF
jgi:CubicO group peptidase (beta-lactamase class C family)